MRCRRIVLGVILSGLLPVAGPAMQGQTVAAPVVDWELLRSRFPEYRFVMQEVVAHNERGPEAEKGLKFRSALDAKGSWGDIHYEGKSKSGWQPFHHCSRILSMAAAARRPGVSPDEREGLEAAVNLALTFWAGRDLQCPNWWYNKIGVPQSLGEAAMLMGSSLSDSNRDYLVNVVLPRSAIGMTGQNKVWLAGGSLMLAILKRDEALARQAAQAVWDEVVVTTEEGIQPDNSFHQHGPQQQFGNYGKAFAVEVQRLSYVLRGTALAIPAGKLDILRNYVLEGLNWVCWRGEMDISSLGRQLMPGQQQGNARSVTRVMQNMMAADPGAAPRYQAFIERNQPLALNDLRGFQWFWRSDYGVFRGADFCVTLKACSPRVIGTETCNSENLSGYHLADGATYGYRRGGEYANIFPVWDWRRLPGVTCAEGTGPLPKTQPCRLPSPFAGGVSDGSQGGAAALDYRRDGVRAHKAWFFGNERVVCLGSGISGPARKSIITSVNQSLHRGPVRVLDGQGERSLAAEGIQALRAVQWLEHDGIRYEFPERPDLMAGVQAQSGTWSRVYMNANTPKEPVVRKVFSCWFAHGVQPAAARYAYVMGPAGVAGEPGVTIERNEPGLQVVSWGTRRRALVFSQPGSFKGASGVQVQVDKPCLILCEGDHAWISDPTQTLQAMTLTLDGKAVPVTFETKGNAGRSVRIDYPR